MKLLAIFALAAAALLAAPAWSAGGGGGGAGGEGSSTSSDPDFRAGVAAWQAKDWQQVLKRMRVVVRRNVFNADAWNYMGHAARQLGDLDNAFKHYERALRIDPAHRGAHEYIGEAYLIVGKPVQAEEHLQALERLCRPNCEEYDDLKAKIETYRREHPA